MKKISLLLLFCVFYQTRAQSEFNGVIAVEITNIKSDEGQILIGLYNSETDWLGTPYMGTIGTIKAGVSTVTFDTVPDGTYAISLFHDADGDGSLNTFLGIPTESTGASNNAPANFGPPTWKDAKFEVNGTTVKQKIKL